MTTEALLAPVNPETEVLLDTPECRHHWVIQAASGPFSPGVCQTCGATKEFKNYVEASTWGDAPSLSRISPDVARAVSRQQMEEEEEE